MKADGVAEEETPTDANEPEGKTPTRPMGRCQAKRLMFGTPDDDIRKAKLARIQAQIEAAKTSAEKDRSIANELVAIREMLKKRSSPTSVGMDTVSSLEMARAEEELLDRQIAIARKRSELQMLNDSVMIWETPSLPTAPVLSDAVEVNTALNSSL